MRKLSLLLLLVISAINCFSQFTINFPTTRATFQRDRNNSTEVPITGNIGRIVDRIEARLVPMATNQGTATAWTTIQTNPQSGSYTGKLRGTGGWYRLEVRSILNSSILETIGVDRIGIGEVFVIAGQSNARGRVNSGEKRSTDDRVNTIEFFNETSLREIPVDWRFTHLEAATKISPLGENSWCWGELGDLLTTRLNVPVMFFNAAFEGSTVTNWRESAEGILTVNPNGTGFITKDFPYLNLRNAITQYGSILGIRAVLWQQGETDTNPFNTSETVYATNLQKLIEISRQHSGKNLSWVIARVSRTFPNVTSTAIINAQNRVIGLPQFNAFAGPATDNITARSDGLHFANLSSTQAGLSQLAQAWNTSLDNNFFNNSNPFAPAPIIPLQIKCNTNNSITLSLSGNYESLRWSNNTTEKSINVFEGIFSAVSKDQTSNYFLTTAVNTNFISLESPPTILAKGPTSICQGNGVELIANTDLQKVRWSTGDTTKSIIIKTTTNVTVVGVNNQSCPTRLSNTTAVKVNDLPGKPSILMLGFQNSCEGNNIILTSSNANLTALWDTPNRDSTRSIIFSKVGNYKTTVRVRDSNGCISLPSDPSEISIKALPATPKIEQTGIYTLGIKTEDFKNGDTFEWKRNGGFFPLKTSNIKVTQAANYGVTVSRYYPIPNNQTLTCTSKPSELFSFSPIQEIQPLFIYPNPSPDGIFNVESIENTTVYARIYNELGQNLGTIYVPLLTERQTINLSYLQSGIYLLDFYDGTSKLKTYKVKIK
jgi:Carbohydrate esterase, sialic acid-specific acetylesterase/Secretion system C-terminal sorting domain